MAGTLADTSVAVDPRASLQRLDAEQLQLCDRLLQLTPRELEQASNLPGWRVVDLAVHITRVCDSILLAVSRASVGDQTPAFGPAAIWLGQPAARRLRRPHAPRRRDERRAARAIRLPASPGPAQRALVLYS